MIFRTLLIILFLCSNTLAGSGSFPCPGPGTSGVSSGGCSGTYGNTATTDGADPNDGAQCTVKQITGVCTSASSSVTMRLKDFNTSASDRYTLVAYSDSSGEPGTLIAYTAGTTSGSVPGGPTTVTQSWSFTPTSSTVWVGICGESWARPVGSSTTGGTARTRYSISNYAAPTSSWASNGSDDADYNSYNLEISITF